MKTIKKFKPADLRPVVNIFGKEYKLPYFGASIGNNLTTEQNLFDIREVIENAFPGIERPESNMVYLHLLREVHKDRDGKSMIPLQRDVTIDDKEYTISFDDIKRRSVNTHEVDGAIYHFRTPSAYELVKSDIEFIATKDNTIMSSILNYLFQYVEYEGEKYKFNDIDGELPHALTHRVHDIIGDIYIELPDGGTVTGVEKIEKLFLTGSL